MKFMLSEGLPETKHVQKHRFYVCKIVAWKYFHFCNCIWISLIFLLNCIDFMLSDILLRKKAMADETQFSLPRWFWTAKPLNTRQASYPLHCLCSSWRTTITAGFYPLYCSKKTLSLSNLYMHANMFYLISDKNSI